MMIRIAEICFWACVGVIAYTYFLYPLLLLCAARLFSRPVRKAPFAGSISIVLAAHNEANRIAARRDELLSLLSATGLRGELIIISDGSTDATAAVARHGADDRVCVIELVRNVGKAEALSRGWAAAIGEVIVLADARQHWAPDAMQRLLENFADPRVGGVSGDLVLEAAPGVIAGMGLYWRYEKALRKLESSIHSTVGATGAIAAVRRSLFRPIPPWTILDDVYWPLRVVMQGFRVVHDGSAIACDRLPSASRDEFHRKVRTLSGNFQLLGRLPAALLPWRNPVWFQFISHKLCRLVVPWAMIGALLACAFIPTWPYRLMLALQVLFYLLAGAAVHNLGPAARWRVASTAGAFVTLNAAAFRAFWVHLFGRTTRSWRKAAYATPAELAAQLADPATRIVEPTALPTAAHTAPHDAPEAVPVNDP